MIKNANDLQKALAKKVEEILQLVAEDVKKEIDEALEGHYSDYTPQYYDRTDQLKNCCKISATKQNGLGISIEVFLDINSLNYTAKGAVPYKTVVASNAGLFGGYNPQERTVVPWDYIKDNTGMPFGNGTQIWEEPMEELFSDGKIIELFKQCAKKRGLNIQ